MLTRNLATAPPNSNKSTWIQPSHSTVIILNEISTAIADGFNARKPHERTVLVALDLSEAFNFESHATLLKLIKQPTLSGALVQWLTPISTPTDSFAMSCRKGKMRFGVSQGSVVAPILYNYYVSNAATPPPHLFFVSNVDDFTAYGVRGNTPNVTHSINQYLKTLKLLRGQKPRESRPQMFGQTIHSIKKSTTPTQTQK